MHTHITLPTHVGLPCHVHSEQHIILFSPLSDPIFQHAMTKNQTIVLFEPTLRRERLTLTSES